MKSKSPLWLLLLICCAFGKSIQAQNVDISWGEVVKESRGSNVLNFIGQDNTGYYVLKGNQARLLLSGYYAGGFVNTYLNERERASLIRLDDKMNPRFEQELSVKFSGTSLSIMAAFKMKETMYLFTSFRNQKTKQKHIFVQSIDQQTLKPQNDIKKVTSLPFKNRYLSGTVQFKFSRDSSHLAVFSIKRSKKTDPEKYSFHVFDQDMNLEWEKEVTLPIQDRLFTISDFQVDNDGNAYMVGKRFFPKEERQKGKPNYEFIISAFRDQGAREAEYVIRKDDKFLSELHLEVGTSGDLICAGFYSQRFSNHAAGTYFLTVDAESGKINKSSFYEFDLDLLNKPLNASVKKAGSKKKKKGTTRELYSFDIRDLIPRGDGGLVMTAEKYYMHQSTSFDSKANVTTTSYHYYYKTILVVSISPSGDIEWATKIPKLQHSVNDGGLYSSYCMMVTDEKLHFVYNDHKDNYGPNRSQKLQNYNLKDKNGIIALASIDTKGNLTKKLLLSNEEIGTILIPKVSLQINQDEMLVYGRRRRKNQFGLLTFQ